MRMLHVSIVLVASEIQIHLKFKFDLERKAPFIVVYRLLVYFATKSSIRWCTYLQNVYVMDNLNYSLGIICNMTSHLLWELVPTKQALCKQTLTQTGDHNRKHCLVCSCAHLCLYAILPCFALQVLQCTLAMEHYNTA